MHVLTCICCKLVESLYQQRDCVFATMQRVVVNCSTVAAVCVHSSRVSELVQHSTWTETCSFVSIFPAVHFQEEIKKFAGRPFSA